MNTNPLNSIETTLGTLCGSQSFFVSTVAKKIRMGLSSEGFTVVKTAQVDRLHSLLTNLRDDNSDEFDEAFEILEGWK